MNTDFLIRKKEYLSMLESSRYMCERNGLDMHTQTLPEVTEADRERCKNHVTGHIRLMRKSTPEYYQAVADTLAANNSVLLQFLTTHFSKIIYYTLLIYNYILIHRNKEIYISTF